MKRLLILIVAIVALQTVRAQGPVYNFNFYNNGSEVLTDGQNPAVSINQAPPVAGPVVKEIVKERKVKGESTLGFELGGGVWNSEFFNDRSGYEVVEGNVNLLFKVSKNIKIKLGLSSGSLTHSADIISYQTYLGSYSYDVNMTGINLGVSASKHLVGAFSLTTELEGQFSFGKGRIDYSHGLESWDGFFGDIATTEMEKLRSNRSFSRKYVGINVGPQLNLGRFYLNIFGKIGYHDINQGDNDLTHGFILGAQANLGFMI